MSLKNLPLPTNGATFTGDLTYYSPGPGYGACGYENTSSDSICAVSHIVWDAASTSSNPNANPLCGKKIRITRYDVTKGGNHSVDVEVVDRCVGCVAVDLDLSLSVFTSLAEEAEGRTCCVDTQGYASYNCPSDYSFCCVTGFNQSETCNSKADCTGSVASAVKVYAEDSSDYSLNDTTTYVQIHIFAETTTALIAATPVPTAVSDFNPSFYFAGPEEDYPACAISPTDCFIAGYNKACYALLPPDSLDAKTPDCICATVLTAGYSCFKQQCSLADRQTIQSVWNSKCNYTVEYYPNQDSLILWRPGSIIAISVVSFFVGSMILVPILLMVRQHSRNDRLGQSQKIGVGSYLLMLVQSNFFDWLASHIMLACTGCYLIVYGIFPTTTGHPRVDTDPCALESLINTPWILAMLITGLDLLFLLLFSIWLYKKKGGSGRTITGTRPSRIALTVIAVLTLVLDMASFGYILYALAAISRMSCAITVLNEPLNNLDNGWAVLPVSAQAILVLWCIFSGLSLMASIFWLSSEWRDKVKWKRARQQTEQEGINMVEERVEITGMRAVRDVYGRREHR
ncbi:Papain inhibitor [Lachnellula suecica]|uniref:Papain inhibitor n=1 Tax=Lachnellula suecica TaxID=602035 RepID=A0A8T9CN33_9HELO|nr:Papain inhibitor [Lachnellula suecica]